MTEIRPERGDVWQTGGVLVWLALPSGNNSWHCLLVDVPDERVVWVIDPAVDDLKARGVSSVSEYINSNVS